MKTSRYFYNQKNEYQDLNETLMTNYEGENDEIENNWFGNHQ